MIPVLKNRLEEIINKFSEIESQLSDNEIDINIRMNLSKEHAELSPIVSAINELQSCQKEIDGVQEILDDKDTDSLLRDEALNEFNRLKNGEMKLIGFFMGQIMKQAKGKANPQSVQKIINKYITDQK